VSEELDGLVEEGLGAAAVTLEEKARGEQAQVLDDGQQVGGGGHEGFSGRGRGCCRFEDVLADRDSPTHHTP